MSRRSPGGAVSRQGPPRGLSMIVFGLGLLMTTLSAVLFPLGLVFAGLWWGLALTAWYRIPATVSEMDARRVVEYHQARQVGPTAYWGAAKPVKATDRRGYLREATRWPVELGDTAVLVADMWGCTVAELMEVNSTPGFTWSPGIVLRRPVKFEQAMRRSTEEIANLYGITLVPVESAPSVTAPESDQLWRARSTQAYCDCRYGHWGFHQIMGSSHGDAVRECVVCQPATRWIETGETL